MGALYPSDLHASHNESIIPKSSKDWGGLDSSAPFSSPSVAFSAGWLTWGASEAEGILSLEF